MSWLELFYDLVFVVAISQVASALNTNLTSEGFLQFSILFMTIWWAWVGHTFYLTRFDSDDLLHRLLGLAQIIAIAGLAAFVPRTFYAESVGFVLSYCTIRGLIIFEYWRAGRHNPEISQLTGRYIKSFSLGIAIWLSSLFFAPENQIYIWAFGVFVDVLTPLFSGTLNLKHPPHISHLPERFGLFTIIILGEAISGVVTGISRVGIDFHTAVTSVLGLLIAFSIWWIYFDSVHGADTRPLTSKQQFRTYQLWLYSHLPLMMGLVICSIGVRQTILTPWMQHLSRNQALALTCGLGVALLSLGAIHYSCPKQSPRTKRFLASIPALAVSGLCLLTAATVTVIPAIGIISILAVFAIAQVVLSLRET